VDLAADGLVIRKAQRLKALAVHPDKNTDPHAVRAFRRVMSAFNVLTDETKRLTYEKGLRLRGLL
jgi:curved DNA-binding protein CbpA